MAATSPALSPMLCFLVALMGMAVVYAGSRVLSRKGRVLALVVTIWIGLAGIQAFKTVAALGNALKHSSSHILEYQSAVL